MLVKPNEFQKQEYFSDDVHSTMTKISPYLIKMLLELAKHEEQEIQIASLRGIEFLLEKLGCTVDNYMIDILRVIVFIYPSKKASDPANEPMSHSPSESFPPISYTDQIEGGSKHVRKEIKSEDYLKLKDKGVKATIVKNKSSYE